MFQLSRFFRESSDFQFILPASRIGLKPPEFFKKKERLIRIPQYLIIFCNNFPEETKAKRGESHCVIFFTFKPWWHSTTQLVPFFNKKIFSITKYYSIVCLFLYLLNSLEVTNRQNNKREVRLLSTPPTKIFFIFHL